MGFKYAFLADNYRDLPFFEKLLDKDFIPLNIFWDNQTKAKNLKNEFNIYIPNIVTQLCRDTNLNKIKFNIDHDFILEYYYKMYNNDFSKFGIDLMSRLNYLYPILDNLIKEHDTVITTNSGHWTSRLLFYICKRKKAIFYFFENFFFRGQFQISNIPFTTSKYGIPELNRIFNNSIYDENDIKFYNDYIKNKISKYLQDDKKIEGEHDIFIVGQIPDDTNVILLDRPYKDTDELCYEIAKLNPNLKIVYKPHPLLNERKFIVSNKLFEFNNILITSASIYDIFEKVKEVYTISSTVGIEAQLFDKKVKWFSNTNYADFHLEIKENAYKFVNACKRYMFPLEKLHEKIYG